MECGVLCPRIASSHQSGDQSNCDLGLISSTDTLSSDQSYLLNTFNRYLGRVQSSQIKDISKESDVWFMVLGHQKLNV